MKKTKRTKTILSISFLVLLTLGLFITDAYARGRYHPRGFPWSKITVFISSAKTEYTAGETATFNIGMTRREKSVRIRPNQIIAAFPDPETQVTLTHISKGHYIYTTPRFEESGTPTLSVTVYSEDAINAVKSLERRKEKIESIIAYLEEVKERKRNLMAKRWIERLIQQLNRMVERIDRKIEWLLTEKGVIGFASSTITIDTIPPVITDLSPPEGTVLSDTQPTISCTYSDEVSDIDVDTVKLTLDREDVTSLAAITETNLTYRPDAPLADTLHQVTVEVSDKAGNSAQASWSFTTFSLISRPVADPDRILAGEPTLVTITAQIDPVPGLDLRNPEVKLLQLNEDNEIVDTLGYLHDDGRNGDAQAGDHIFTIQTTFTGERSPQIKLQVSVGYTSQDTLVFSGIFIITVEPIQAQIDMGSSLRLLTLNTQLLDTDFLSLLLDPAFLEALLHAFGEIPDIENQYGMDNDERAKATAKAILNMDPLPDIIALQEVFDNDAKDEFEEELKVKYPNYVYRVDASDLDPFDSGLMLFSRFPFAPLLDKQYTGGDVTAYTKQFGTVKEWDDEVAFIEFDDHSGWDGWANKGVGLVRIQVVGPPNPKYINVTFAHTEASYGADDVGEAWERVMNRRGQLDDIDEIIHGSLSDYQLDDEPVFVMGDLNINGNPDSMSFYWGNVSKNMWNNLKAADADKLLYNYEWDYHFNRFLSNSFFSTYLSDSWMYDTVETDAGQTIGGDFPDYLKDNPTQGERTDHILHNNNKVIGSAVDMLPYGGMDIFGRPMLCIQHIRRVWEPVLGEQQYSDHIGVMADINLYAPYCNPLIAYVAKPQPDEQIHGKITHKGSMQWYRVEDEGGSYSIATSGPVKFEVYEAWDLSRPIRSSGEMTEWGMQYSIPEVPFYIRVFADDPLWVGDYTINIHLHEGKSKEDAILLDPLAAYLPNSYEYGYQYQMPTISQINPENIVWFKILPEQGETNFLGSMKAILDSSHPPSVFENNNFTLELMTKDDNVIAVSQPVPFPYSEYPNLPSYDMWRDVLDRDPISQAKYYLRVRSEYPFTQGYIFVIQWQTDLTYFIPGWLRCYEQEDDTGDDDIYTDIRVDNILVQKKTHLGAFDDGGEDPGEWGTQKAVAGSMGKHRYVGHMDIKLWEWEGWPSNSYTYLGSQQVNTLPMDKKEAEIEKTWIKGDPNNNPVYDYRLRVRLYHQLPKQLQ